MGTLSAFFGGGTWPLGGHRGKFAPGLSSMKTSAAENVVGLHHLDSDLFTCFPRGSLGQS